MKKLLYILLLITSTLSAQDYWVTPRGNDSNHGTDSSSTGAWATWQKAFNEAEPGDTVYIRGGVYKTSKPTAINPDAFPSPMGVSGTRENPIHYFGYPPDVKERNMPILDCIQHCDSIVLGYDGNIYNSAIYLRKVEYIHFKDMEIRNVFQCDSVLNGAITAAACANLTFEHIIMHDIGQRGYWIEGGAWGESLNDGTEIFAYDTTKWINCDVYNLFDTISSSPGNGADAWKTIHYSGNYLLWDGCRAWYYADDGWDPNSSSRGGSGKGAIRVLTNCWAMASNKYRNNYSTGWQTERNGFKFASGGDDPDPWNKTVIMKNCLALYCNTGMGEIYDALANGEYYNNTSFKNGIGITATPNSTSIFKNNLVFGSTAEDPGLKRPYNIAIHNNTTYIESHNTWDKTASYPHFEMTDSLDLNDDDFVTVDSLELVELFTAPRNIDGSLPPFPLKLAPDSDLKDAGIDVGLPFNGVAPDIGAFEYAAPATSRGKGSSAGGGKMYIRNGKIYVR